MLHLAISVSLLIIHQHDQFYPRILLTTKVVHFNLNGIPIVHGLNIPLRITLLIAIIAGIS
ncbi:unnamed protein product, partial [Rotaria socialis]